VSDGPMRSADHYQAKRPYREDDVVKLRHARFPRLPLPFRRATATSGRLISHPICA